MAENTKKVPEIRFPGFNDAWEQRKLGEILKYEQPGAYIVDSTDYDDSFEIPVLTAGQSFILGYTNETNGIKNASPENPVIIFDDFTTSSHFVDFAFKVKSSAMKLLTLNDKNDDIYCINNILENVDYMPASHERHWISIFSNIDVNVPADKEEQSKIGDYFRQIDNLITLHQRECDTLKKLKAGMLQKMFPQNGESVPEIRFPGFTDAWEQRKFGEIVEKYEDPVETPTNGYMRLGIRSHAKGTFHSYVEAGKELETAKMFRVAANNFIVNITFGWEHAVAITDENDAGKLVSHRFPQYSFNKSFNPKFFRYLILDEKFKHHLELASPGGAGRNRVLKLNDMLEYKMNFPTEDEQNLIAAYFDRLDSLITLHQRECDILKKMKAGMLQKMFVS